MKRGEITKGGREEGCDERQKKGCRREGNKVMKRRENKEM